MKTAIQIIKEAYDFIGIPNVGPGGKFSGEGLLFLNQLLYDWNADFYFPFTQNTVDGHVRGGRALIAPDDPEAVFNGEKPVNVESVLYKYGSCSWVKLKRISYAGIFERKNSESSPYSFAFTNDSQGRGVLEFDCENGDFDCRVIYNKNIPAMDYNDILAAPPQYEHALLFGIAELASVARGMPKENTLNYEKLKNDTLNSIEKNNSYKHEIDCPAFGIYDLEDPYDRVMRRL